MSRKRIQQFIRENGLYVLSGVLMEMPLRLARNYLIAAKFGVRKLNIGPRAYLRGLSAIKMGEDFSAGEGLWLQAIFRYQDQQFSPRIVIGDHVRISSWVHIAATNSVSIGDHVLVGSKVMISDHNHGQYGIDKCSPPQVPPSERLLDHNRTIKIGPNVWLGDGVVVTPDSNIGEGCVIGANSVVRGSIPSFSIAAGVPARIIKRFDTVNQKWTHWE